MKTTTILLALPVLAVLAACSEGGGGERDSRLSDAEALAALYGIGSGSPEYTDPTTVPATGSASYNGYMGIWVDAAEGSDPDVLGDVAMSVALGSGDISGSATNFADGDGSYGGSLALDGAFDRTADADRSVSIDSAGNLTAPDGTDLAITARSSGGMVGPNAEAIFTTGDGSATSVDGEEWFDFTIIAAQD